MGYAIWEINMEQHYEPVSYNILMLQYIYGTCMLNLGSWLFYIKISKCCNTQITGIYITDV